MDPGTHTTAALQRITPDPFAQAALWRLYTTLPAALNAETTNDLMWAVARDNTDAKEA